MIVRLARVGFLSSLVKVHLSMCKPCLPKIVTEKPFNKIKRVSSTIKLVHLDIYGPPNVMARHGACYLSYSLKRTLNTDLFT